MDTTDVRRWIAEGERELAALNAELERAQFRLADKRRQLMLLYEVLASLTNSPVAIPAGKMGFDVSVRARVQSDVEHILRKYGRPMRIQDIHAEFVRNAFPLPGRGTPTNIAAHLVDVDRFRRFGRGVYGLVAWEASADTTSDSADDQDPAGGIEGEPSAAML